MNPFVQIFILSHNRVEYVRECIDSALAQKYSHFEVILSDNSDNDEVKNATIHYLKNPYFKYIKRNPSLSALEHFNTLLNEPTGNFFMLFHDDDVLLPDAITKAIEVFNRQPNLVAVGGNAFFINERQKTFRYFSTQLKKRDVLVSNIDRFIYAYIKIKRDYPPFPSYIYRTSKVKSLQINPQFGGKYADVSFLAQLCKIGSLYWIHDPILHYRVHSSNDSASISISHILSLCKFFLKESPTNRSLITKYKLKQYAVWTYQRLGGKVQGLSPKRDFVIMKSVLLFFLTHPMNFIIYAIKLFLGK